MLIAGLRRLGGRVFDFIRCKHGIAATEFALLSPVLILVYVGAGEVSQAVMTSRKVELLSRTLADLTSQQPTYAQSTSTPAPANAISQASLQAELNAALAIMAPGPLTSLKMTISAVDIVNNAQGNCCVFNVRWSYTQGGTLRPCNTPLKPVDPTLVPTPTTVSNDLLPPIPQLPSSMSLSLIIADVWNLYQGPFSSSWINFASGMQRTSYMFPRTTGQVILAGTITPTGTQSGVICY